MTKLPVRDFSIYSPVDIRPLRTLEEQINALASWVSPAETNFLEGIRRARRLGVIAPNRLAV